LECRTDPPDKVAALIEQRQVWEEMMRKARARVAAGATRS